MTRPLRAAALLVVALALLVPSLTSRPARADDHVDEIKGLAFNPDQITVRAGDSVTWVNHDSDRHHLQGDGFESNDLPNNSTTAFGCLASPGATSFAIPTSVLANVPPTRANPLQSKDVIYIGNAPNMSSAVNLTGTGLDAGFVAFQYATGKTVIFQ